MPDRGNARPRRIGARWRIAAAGATAAAGAAVVALVAGGGDYQAAAVGNANGLFRTACEISHRAPDDPIVRPDLPGRSHLHDFFGSRTTNAFSTPDSVRIANTTCARGADSSAYWVPTLLSGDTPVRPAEAHAYYRVGGVDPVSIEPFPKGFMMVAGDATALEEQAGKVVTWGCTRGGAVVRRAARKGDDPAAAVRKAIAGHRPVVLRARTRLARGRSAQRARRRAIARLVRNGRPVGRQRKQLLRHRRILARQARHLRRARRELGDLRRALAGFSRGRRTSIATCNPGAHLELLVRFPECWDGERLDSPDHSSHMAYASRGPGRFKVCPRSHPVALPKLALRVRYPTLGGPGVGLSAGGAESGHADFMNGWEQEKLDELVESCLNKNIYCADGDGRS